jgi:hypothetical protein
MRPEMPGPEHPVWRIVGFFPPAELGEKAWSALERELPLLVSTSRGQWAAYHADERVGVGPKIGELYEECLRRGFSPDECVICRIEPIGEEVIIGLGMGIMEEYEEEQPGH